jgi:hypothetical protein
LRPTLASVNQVERERTADVSMEGGGRFRTIWSDSIDFEPTGRSGLAGGRTWRGGGGAAKASVALSSAAGNPSDGGGGGRGVVEMEDEGLCCRGGGTSSGSSGSRAHLQQPCEMFIYWLSDANWILRCVRSRKMICGRAGRFQLGLRLPP